MALKAVFFDVGETLVDEERWWRELAERSGLQPHVVWAALGVTIERGEEHDALWGHLGIERPDGWWHELTYSIEDLYPDATSCLEAAAAGLVAVHVRRGPWGRLQPTPPEAALGIDDLASLPEALASLS